MAKVRGISTSYVTSKVREVTAGITAFEAVAVDYIDYCSMFPTDDENEPLSLSKFFENVTFNKARGDWITFQNIHEHMGTKDVAVDKYLDARKSSRSGNIKKKNFLIGGKIDDLEASYTKDPKFKPDLKDDVSRVDFLTFGFLFYRTLTTSTRLS